MEDPHKAVLRPRNAGEALKVAEAVLKRRDRNIKAARARAEKVQKLKAQRKTMGTANLSIKSAAKMLQHRKISKQEKGRLKSAAKKVPAKVSKGRAMLLVVRNGREGGGHEVKTRLKELGLNGRNRGVLLRNNADTAAGLRIVEPFCFWGPPTLQGVTDLLHKKAMMRGEGEGEEGKGIVPLQDNRRIEELLGEHGLLCIEDLVDCLYNGKPAFEDVTRVLVPMQFADERTNHGLTKEIKHLYGNQKRRIDEHLQKLLG